MSRIKQAVAVLLIVAVMFVALDFLTFRLPFFQQMRVDLHDSAGLLRVRSRYYHHDFAPNIDIVDRWGPLRFRVCTDRNGFRCAPGEMNRDDTTFDVAFVGDSFTEGSGYDYEKTFVGMYAARHPELRVANLGVSSYCTSLYYRKVKHYLDAGLTFRRVVVFVDISDIFDEAATYSPDDDYSDMRPLRKLPMYLPLTASIGKWAGNALADGVAWLKRTIGLTAERGNGGEAPAPGRTEPGKADYRLRYYLSDWTATSDIPVYGKKGVEGGIQQAVGEMTRLKALLDERGIGMWVGVYPWPGQLYYGVKEHRGVTLWRDFARRTGCGFIDANAAFFDDMKDGDYRAAIEKYYIPGDVHFNAEGNRVLYRELERQFVF